MTRRTVTKTSFPQGLGQCAFDGPSSGESACNAGAWKSCGFGPSHQGLRLTVERQQAIAPLVPLLLLLRNPAAILRSVRPVGVHAIQKLPLGACSHVRVEVSEVPPPVADGDAATSIQVPADVVGVGAAFNHRTPRVPCRRLAHHVAAVQRTDGVSFKAPARSCIPVLQVHVVDHDFLAAVASAAPSCKPLLRGFRAFNSDQPAKAHPGYIGRFCHGTRLPQ